MAASLRAEEAMYDDAGEGYAYERGGRVTVVMRWNDAARRLELAARPSGPGIGPE